MHDCRSFKSEEGSIIEADINVTKYNVYKDYIYYSIQQQKDDISLIKADIVDVYEIGVDSHHDILIHTNTPLHYQFPNELPKDTYFEVLSIGLGVELCFTETFEYPENVKCKKSLNQIGKFNITETNFLVQSQGAGRLEFQVKVWGSEKKANKKWIVWVVVASVVVTVGIVVCVFFFMRHKKQTNMRNNLENEAIVAEKQGCYGCKTITETRFLAVGCTVQLLCRLYYTTRRFDILERSLKISFIFQYILHFIFILQYIFPFQFDQYHKYQNNNQFYKYERTNLNLSIFVNINEVYTVIFMDYILSQNSETEIQLIQNRITTNYYYICMYQSFINFICNNPLLITQNVINHYIIHNIQQIRILTYMKLYLYCLESINKVFNEFNKLSKTDIQLQRLFKQQDVTQALLQYVK
ncbi:Hypothetical_protein [Hexamita inflata]|uniref:Hypothetical_protein n=1 Tax=Hexamita inflata TaxID=28002 RepID=A0AA86QR51_9EUKA|nr:Hypothetical protein HINF_LOCUS46657 [Hexamita inflata]